MKKFLLVLVIGATFVACNDSATTETPASDSPAMAPAMDTPSTMSMDTPKMSMDTPKMSVDTPKTK